MSIPLDHMRGIVLKLFPWLAHVRLGATGKGLSLRTAEARLHLEGDASDPAVIRATDTGGQLAHNSLDSTLYYLAPGAAAYVPVASYAAVPGPPPAVFAGTVIKLGPGSGKVTCG